VHPERMFSIRKPSSNAIDDYNLLVVV
jgi:hypothetical protein